MGILFSVMVHFWPIDLHFHRNRLRPRGARITDKTQFGNRLHVIEDADLRPQLAWRGVKSPNRPKVVRGECNRLFGAPVQERSFALVRERFALVRAGLAPVRHFGGLGSSVPAGVANADTICPKMITLQNLTFGQFVWVPQRKKLKTNYFRSFGTNGSGDSIRGGFPGGRSDIYFLFFLPFWGGEREDESEAGEGRLLFDSNL